LNVLFFVSHFISFDQSSSFVVSLVYSNQSSIRRVANAAIVPLSRPHSASARRISDFCGGGDSDLDARYFARQGLLLLHGVWLSVFCLLIQ
jgi:hypothetical protein